LERLGGLIPGSGNSRKERSITGTPHLIAFTACTYEGARESLYLASSLVTRERDRQQSVGAIIVIAE
jgi:hypothetical protein